MTKEALQLALEALRFALQVGFDESSETQIKKGDKAWRQHQQAINAIKEALETKDEPVAWMNRHGACKTSLFREMEAGAKEEYTIPVYTTPPQRTWVGLKDDDEIPWDGVDAKSFARAIEAKLKEKNGY